MILYGINIQDPTSGLRGYHRSLIKEIKFESGYDYIVGANRLISKYKKYARFVSITARYTDYSLNKGLNLRKGVILFMKMLLMRFKEIVNISNKPDICKFSVKSIHKQIKIDSKYTNLHIRNE